MQKARDQPFPLRGVGLSPLVGMWFQVHYPPLVGVLPTFRSRYWFAIGLQRVLSLTGWSPQIRTAFHVRGLTQDTPRPFTLTSTGLSPAMAGCSKAVRLGIGVLNGVLQPRRDMSLRFGLVRVRSPLLTESLLLSLPPGTEMFQFPGLARVSRDQYSFDSFPELFAVFHALTPSGA
jgi:hypothetical protein